MTSTLAGETGGAPPRAQVLRKYARFSGGFWRGATARMAIGLTIGLAIFLILRLGVDVGMNRWSRWFFDALERRDATVAAVAALAFPALVLCVAAVGVGIIWMRETLQVRWREWCTARLLDRWLEGKRFYRMRLSRGGMANPEYRISDDVRMATEPLTDLAIGLFTALLTASAFVAILWTVGGDLNITLGGADLHVPAFMVIGAVIYGVVVSALMPLIGGSLAGAVATKNEAEARFRFDLLNLRESAESIVLSQGEAHGRKKLAATYTALASAWLRVVGQHARVTWLTNANTAMAPVFPLVLAAPKYLAGELTLGEVMQLASAFAQVQIAIAWLVDHYTRVAEWFASAQRVIELVDELDASDGRAQGGAPLISRNHADGPGVEIEGLKLVRPSGEIVVTKADARFEPGDRIILSGPAGVGKSSLLRAISGLWLWGEGEIRIPRDCAIAYVASHSALHSGRLGEILSFPEGADAHSSAHRLRALEACGAGHLAERLDVIDNWDQALSAREKQCVALARLLVTQPRIVILEDAFSCFGAAEQIALFDLLACQLPDAILMTTGGVAGLADLHSRRFVLERNEAGEVHLIERGAERRSVRETQLITGGNE